MTAYPDGGPVDPGCGCGCGCRGAALPTPADVHNPPGLPALAYRTGTHGAFLAAMLERLASRPALDALRTREGDDPAVALLDCWAVVADVLTFYTERHAQEGYLPTATEPASLAWLGRLVGHRPRPALGAGAHLAYTLDPGARTLVPAGSQARSVPPQGRTPQTFETTEDLTADAEWNTLDVRRTAPPRLDPATAAGLERLTLTGAALALKPGDRLLFHFGTAREPAVRAVARAVPDFAAARTAVELVPPTVTDPVTTATATARETLAHVLCTAPGLPSAAPLREALTAAAARLDGAPPDPDGPPDGGGTSPGAGTGAATGAAGPGGYTALADASRLVAEGVAFTGARPGAGLDRWLAGPVAAARRALRAAVLAVAGAERRSLPEVEYLRALARALACPRSERTPDEDTRCDRATALVATAAVLPALRRPPSRPPASARDLTTGPGDLWDPASDALPALLAAADPHLADGIHRAWATQAIAPPRPASAVQVLRVKARPVAPPAAGTRTAGEAAPDLYLEGAHDALLPGTWLVAERAGSPNGPRRARITAAAQLRLPVTVPAGGPRVTVPVTRVTLDAPWHDEVPAGQSVPYEEITVWAGGEDLALADEPLTDDVGGATLELDRVHSGLRPGRLLAVSGERTDIPGTTGVRGSEPAMVAAVRQGVDADTGGDSVHPTLVLATPLAYTYRRETVTVHGNVVPATQGETRTEVLGSGDAARPGQSFPLRQTTPEAPLTHLPDDTPGGARPALTVRVDAVAWHPVEDLSVLGPLDHGHLLTGDAPSARVVFGDGVHGSRPATGVENVTAVYRTGAGTSGNLPPGRITQLASRPLGVNAVTNPLPATGGTDADAPRDTRTVIPLRTRALDRLLSVRDYADFSRARAGIGRAVAARLFDGRRELVHVTVAAAGDAPADPSDPLLSALTAALTALGDPDLPVRVDVRELVLLVLSAGLKVLPDHDYATVEPAVRSAVLGVLGFAARDLAQPAHLSRVLAAVHAVPGVDRLDVDLFTGIPANAGPLALAGLVAALDGAADTVEAFPARAGHTHHTVGHDPTGARDTLSSIALRHALTVEQLVALNPALRSVRLRPGQRLTVSRGIRPAQLAVMSPDLPETLILRRIP
ncbi:hypothetical protein GCM10010302_64890 [Streptomyces polychromogenes]|uniref:LysM domain-containing protein n=1 Tax=Streptomyces polychromogenes TaxID=67342 RepID=A0ABN0VTD4_9ACTN